MSCLDPAKMYTSPELCQSQMKGLVKQFIQDKQLDGGIAAGGLITQQFAQLLSLEVRDREEFFAYKPLEKRLDVFLHTYISHPYPQLWAFIRKLLLLSHGQATVERGFSVNKEVEISNIQEDTIVAHRIVCDYVSLHGGVLKEVAGNLARDADKLAEQAESKQGSKMTELIVKSNAFRRSHKDKLAELKNIDEEIVAKGVELGNL
ncbi:unnamed protein product [Leuciscus chuanchicus]